MARDGDHTVSARRFYELVALDATRERVRRSVTAMAAKRQRTGVEWVGGLLSMPAYVTGEGDPYRPEALFWMSTEGAVLGHAVGKPGELVGLVCESLRSTIERPMFGRPHAPERIRVSSPELAEALRAGNLGLEVVCAPTPEIDAFLAAALIQARHSVMVRISWSMPAFLWTKRSTASLAVTSCGTARLEMRMRATFGNRCLACSSSHTPPLVFGIS